MKKLYNINKKGVVIHVDRTKLSEHLSFQKMFIPTWLWLSLCVAIVIASYSEERKASDVHSLRITTEYVTDFSGNGNVEVIETSEVRSFDFKEEYTEEDKIILLSTITKLTVENFLLHTKLLAKEKDIEV